MSPEMEKALIELRRIICDEYPHTTEATVRFKLNGVVEVEVEAKQAGRI